MRTDTFSPQRQFAKTLTAVPFYLLVRFSADRHVCRFRHHDRQAAGWDHSAYPAVQPHHRQDKVRRSALIQCNTHITANSPCKWSWLIVGGSRQQFEQPFLRSVDGSRDLTLKQRPHVMLMEITVSWQCVHSANAYRVDATKWMRSTYHTLPTSFLLSLDWLYFFMLQCVA